MNQCLVVTLSCFDERTLLCEMLNFYETNGDQNRSWID